MKFPRATHRVLITSSKSNAEKWKRRIAKYLANNLRLALSDEKTIVTDIRKKPIHFLGFTFKMVKGKARKGFIPRTNPDPQRLKAKVKEIHRNIKELKRIRLGIKHDGNEKEHLISGINRVNSQIRGIIQYYQAATWVSVALGRYDYMLGYAGYKALKRYGGKWIAADKVSNLTSVHAQYKTQIPAIERRGYTVGVTSLVFCKWRKAPLKNQSETPYSKAGRDMFQQRTSRKRLLARADELFLSQPTETGGKNSKLYNFEYYLNRAYSFNKDSGQCKVCGEFLINNVHTHHINPNLTFNLVNRVANLASTHPECHEMLHDDKDYSSVLPERIWLKVLRLREKLNIIS